MSKHPSPHRKRRAKPDVVRATLPLVSEAPSSWITRFALSQGAALKEVLEHLRLARTGNIDLQFLRLDLSAVERTLGVSMVSMGPTVELLKRLERVDPGGRTLMFRHAGAGQFRYCPMCFAASPIAFIPIEWRIVTWRFCPRHHCLLETGCAECGAATVLPVDMINAAKGVGVAHLKDCMRCGKSLATRTPCLIKVAGPGAFQASELVMLSNGRAVLATLLTGRFYANEHGTDLGLRGLRSWVRRGLMPIAPDWLEPGSVRARVRAGEVRAARLAKGQEDASIRPHSNEVT